MAPNNQLPPALILAGPTASGKTDLALELVSRLPVEIISVDSGMVYRGMDIGTAKPDAATLAQVPHRLVNIIDPDERYSAGRFRHEALAAMAEITARGRVPLLVGGTMLYFKVLTDGIADMPIAHPGLRAEIDARARREGWPALHAELARLDPESARRVAPMDAQRIERALEVVIGTGSPLSAHWSRRRENSLPYRLARIGLVPGERATLHARIERRFGAMLDAGLVEEVRALRARFVLNPDLPSMRCVGYRQVWRHLEGEGEIAELFERGVVATRQLARRQLTWLRAMDGFDAEDPFAPGAAARVIERFSRALC
jgi:tRNA dimethylallyltransferase